MATEATAKKSVQLIKWVRNLHAKGCEDKLDKLKQEGFMKEFHQAQLDLEAARNNYNYADEPALLEYYIYAIKAAETKLNYYLKLAKQDHLSNHRYFVGMMARYEEKGEKLT